MKRLWNSLPTRDGQPSLWLLFGIAAIVAILMLASLGPAGASRLFQSEEESSVPGVIETDTPPAEQPTVPSAGTQVVPASTPVSATVVRPTTSSATGQPPAPTAVAPKPTPAQPTAIQPTAVQITPRATTVGVQPTYTPIAGPPTPVAGGPAPIVWIIVGLVIVGLVVVIILSPGRKPKDTV